MLAVSSSPAGENFVPTFDLNTKFHFAYCIASTNLSGKTFWKNTNSNSFRKKLDNSFGNKQIDLEAFCRRNGADYLNINTSEDYVPKLIKLFKIRNKVRKSG